MMARTAITSLFWSYTTLQRTQVLKQNLPLSNKRRWQCVTKNCLLRARRMSCRCYRMGQMTWLRSRVLLTWSRRLRNLKGVCSVSRSDSTAFALITTSNLTRPWTRPLPTHLLLTYFKKTQLERYRYRTWHWCILSSSAATTSNVAPLRTKTRRNCHRNFCASISRKSIARRTCADHATTKWATLRSHPNALTKTNLTTPRACARTVTWATIMKAN